MSTAALKLVVRLLILSTLITSHAVFAQSKQIDAHYRLLSGGSYAQSKNYYLLTLFRQLPEVRAMLSGDTALRAMGTGKLDSLRMGLSTCERDGSCYISHLSFNEAEIALVSERLRSLYRPDNALGRLVKNHLVPSGTYILFQDLPAADMLARAWTQDAEGINYAIGVYADGKKPNYPNIDSISFNTHDRGYVSLLYNTASLTATENTREQSFFSIPLTAVLRFVDAILIDPHARHTTTNMRNTVRMIYRYGIPSDKAALTCTTRGQSAMIEKTLIDRCKRELNEVPYSNGKRLSETEMEFYPKPEALQINPLEPLDP
jgi:hypothetical protein